MLVRRRGPRRIPGPRRPHPCGKDIMTFSLVDFMGYCMSVISAIEHLKIDSDFDNWQVSLDGVDSVSGGYHISLCRLEKPAKRVQVKTKKQKRSM